MRWQTELMLKRGDSAAHRQVHGSKMGGMLCTVEGLTRSCKRSGKFSKTVAFKPACCRCLFRSVRMQDGMHDSPVRHVHIHDGAPDGGEAC